MMVRCLLLVAMCAVLLGTSCPGASTAIPCANSLDGSEFGFTLTVPDSFTCAPALPIQFPEFILAFVSYMDSSTDYSLSVVVSQSISGDTSGSSMGGLQGSVEELGSVTNTAGIEFALVKGTPEDGSDTRVSYSAAAELTDGGNILLISIMAPADDAGLLETLRGIVESVQRA